MLLAGMSVVWLIKDNWAPGPGRRTATFQQMARVGEGFFYALTGVQLGLILLAAPAATAGAICMDRARGTLAHMMVTDLSDREIVLGKLGARLAPVLSLIVCAVPVTALAALLGGIEFEAIVGSFTVSLAVALVGCSLALAFSVRVKKIHEVLTAAYAIQIIALLALPFWQSAAFSGVVPRAPDWFVKLNPVVLALAPYVQPGFAKPIDYAIFLGGAMAIAATLTSWSTASLRRVVLEQTGRPEKGARRRELPRLRQLFPSFFGPTLDGNPVFWREWHRNRPSRLSRRIWAVLLIGTWAMAACDTYEILQDAAAVGRTHRLVTGIAFQMLFGLLMVSATAPTSLAEERARGSLDVLLATPMSSRSIVLGKWWGVYQSVLVLMWLPIFGVGLLALTAPDVAVFPTARGAPWVPLNAWDRVAGPVLCLLDVLVSVAVVASIGIVAATKIERQSRAVTLSVATFFLVTIGWALVVDLSFSPMNPLWNSNWVQRNDWLVTGLRSCTPVGASAIILHTFDGPLAESPTWNWFGIAGAIIFKGLLAWGLLWFITRIFDRCMGRVVETG
jgi:ABC-type transport system involved in multi-copper enzyme maturation permease subunit